MADPFLAEIRIFACNFAPQGWALCNGQLLALSQNTALFALLGTTYGGNGQSNFALPDLQGSAPLHPGQSTTGSNYFLGEMSGVESVTLLQSETPVHSHSLTATQDPADDNDPGSTTVLARSVGGNAYATVAPNAYLDPSALAPDGGSIPHNNMQPYIALNFCIALQGVFPMRP